MSGQFKKKTVSLFPIFIDGIVVTEKCGIPRACLAGGASFFIHQKILTWRLNIADEPGNLSWNKQSYSGFHAKTANSFTTEEQS